MSQGSTRSSLTAFKTARGLVCRCVSARFVASSGASCWPRSRELSACWPGPHGAAGTKGSPNIGTINDAQFHKYNCSTKWPLGRRACSEGVFHTSERLKSRLNLSPLRSRRPSRGRRSRAPLLALSSPILSRLSRPRSAALHLALGGTRPRWRRKRAFEFPIHQRH